MKLSVIIPSYKNKKQLLDNLKHNMKYLGGCEVIVVNDDPSESLKADFAAFPGVTLIENRRNLGFGATVNVGAHKATHDLMMLLNTDVLLFDESYASAVAAFRKNDKLFGVSFAQKERDGKTVGKNRLYWDHGFIQHRRDPDNEAGPNGWAEGGSCIIDRNKFLKLGGFDPLYTPFYWEDIDLSFRAWKSGYSIVFDPKILVEHHHESTIGKYFTRNYIKTIAFRNQLIFMWKNVTAPGLMMAHIIRLPMITLKPLLKGDATYLKGFLAAVGRWGQIHFKRTDQKKLFTISDDDVIHFFSD